MLNTHKFLKTKKITSKFNLHQSNLLRYYHFNKHNQNKKIKYIFFIIDNQIFVISKISLLGAKILNL